MSEQQPVEWIGGQVPFSTTIASAEPTPATLMLWIELPADLVVGQHVLDADAPELTFAQTFMQAVSKPLVGAPRRPQRVRVATEELAAQLRELSVVDEVVVAPTPEVDALVKSLDAYLGRGSYFSDPQITREDVAEFFAAAVELWQAAPWQFAKPDELLSLDVEAIGITDGCLSVTGAAGFEFGFELYPEMEDYREMVDLFVSDELDDPDAKYNMLAVTFDSAADTPPGMREEVRVEGWPLPDDNDRYPVLGRVRDGFTSPVTHTDLRFAVLIMRALANFTKTHSDAFSKYGDLTVRETFTDREGRQAVLTVPHPEVDLEELEDPPRAPTLAGGSNPYQLALSAKQLAQLDKHLRGFGVHQLIGMFVAVASMPTMLPPSTWMSALAPTLGLASKADAQTLFGLLMQVHNEVLDRMKDGLIDELVPETDDVEACRTWALGYASICAQAGLTTERGSREAEALSALYMLTERPEFVAGVPPELQDVDSEALRENLVDDVAFLFGYWEWQRAKAMTSAPPAAKAEPVRVGLKVGRNDPCTCGSGKKFKKCCG